MDSSRSILLAQRSHVQLLSREGSGLSRLQRRHLAGPRTLAVPRTVAVASTSTSTSVKKPTSVSTTAAAKAAAAAKSKFTKPLLKIFESAFPYDSLAQWLLETSPDDVNAELDKWGLAFQDYFEKKRTSPNPESVKYTIDEKTRLIQNEIEKYGELVQTVYDTLDTKDVMSPEFGKCNPDAMRVGVQLKEYDNKSITVSTEAREYMVKRRLYADSGAYHLVVKNGRNYVGYVAQSPPDSDGKVDIAVVFRGTITQDDWVTNAKSYMVRWNDGRDLWPEPKERDDAGVSFREALDWFVYNVKTVFSTRLNPDDDARLSYGFKEMYCAADYRAIIKNQQATIKSENSQVLPACNPRMDVFRELTEILLDESVQIKSITVTGHSLGASLATICGYDIGTTITRTIKDPTKNNRTKQEIQNDFARANIAIVKEDDDIFTFTDVFRDLFEEALALRFKDPENYPPVGVVAFASPRIGDINFVKAFNTRSLVDPWPLQQSLEGLSFIEKIGALFRDIGPTITKTFGYWVSCTINFDGISGDWLNYLTEFLLSGFLISVTAAIGESLPASLVNVKWALYGLIGFWTLYPWVAKAIAGLDGTVEKKFAKMSLLRLSNAQDTVPSLPFINQDGRWYIHGGYEVMRNAYIMDCYKTTGKIPVLNWWCPWASIGARHNMEMYLHLMDPTRDIALMNKSDDIVPDKFGVPPCWWPSKMKPEKGSDGEVKWVKSE